NPGGIGDLMIQMAQPDTPDGGVAQAAGIDFENLLYYPDLEHVQNSICMQSFIIKGTVGRACHSIPGDGVNTCGTRPFAPAVTFSLGTLDFTAPFILQR